MYVCDLCYCCLLCTHISTTYLRTNDPVIATELITIINNYYYVRQSFDGSGMELRQLPRGIEYERLRNYNDVVDIPSGSAAIIYCSPKLPNASAVDNIYRLSREIRLCGRIEIHD